MGVIRKIRHDPDRYLTRRAGIYNYKRRIPLELQELDLRGPLMRISLKTTDLVQARMIRDAYEAADDELWASMAAGEDVGGAQQRYTAAIKRAKAMGFTYQTPAVIAQGGLDVLLQRVEALVRPDTPKPTVKAVLGLVDAPQVTVTAATKIYLEEITPHEVSGKSKSQKKRWTDGKNLSTTTFVEVCGDLDMHSITRDHARTYYDSWMAKIAPKEGLPTHTASSGNRRLGDIRTLYAEYFKHIGQPDRVNPFARMTFRERGRRRRVRPPIPHDWIINTILKPGALAGLNDEARAIVLVCANIGARPSEICNLQPERICLQHNIPHLKIEPDEDPEDPREIKTESSIRVVPLTGMALESMRKFPKGFPRYKDNEGSLSATLNKYFRTNKLMPSKKHTMYSFRHSFEDRMKEARVDSEIRKILMGHTVDRPEYGEGGSLRLRLEEITKVDLPYDPSIV